MIGIYEICNQRDGKATTYVGSSIDIKRRWNHHRCLLGKGGHFNVHLQNAWDRYGEDAFEWRVIEEIKNRENLLEREQFWLDHYLGFQDACYNIAITAGPAGPMSEETRRKIGNAHRGKRQSEEHRRKIGEANRGKPPWSTGKKLSAKTRRKISNAHARPYPEFIHRHTGEVIPAGNNLKKLCTKYGLSRWDMWEVANGNRKSHKGWKLASLRRDNNGH